jgi:hypothetical protein
LALQSRPFPLHNFLLAENGRQFMRHPGEDEIVEGEVTPLQSALVKDRNAEIRISTVLGASLFSWSRYR